MRFHPASNLFLSLVLSALALALVGGVATVWAWPRTDYATRIGFIVQQPVPFSHKHHVGGLGIDCRYCHTTVERAASAGMPTTDICMSCHSQIWTDAPMLAPVRASLAERQPIRWRRVHWLPDYVYFDHSIHVAKGVGCETCHGDVREMPLTWRAHSLEMSWCLDCHRDPAPSLRPAAAVFTMGWRRGPETPSGTELMRQLGVHTAGLTDCTVCHR